MKIAIIGSGISGLVVAHKLQHQHDITIFESNNYIGGHTNTIEFEYEGEAMAVDTGFIVFNNWTYPNFIELLHELRVAYKPTDMSFSVKSDSNKLEYSGSSLNSLFAQRSNLLRPSFYKMLADIMRFNKESVEFLETGDETLSLGHYLTANRYSEQFINHYIVPMGAAIWSTEPSMMLDFPALYFIRFFKNHGLLSIDNRPQWYVIKGGSKRYVEALTKPFLNDIHLNSAVVSVERQGNQVEITCSNNHVEKFDRVFIASHSDQALAMLKDPSPAEQRILSAIKYIPNEAVLHTDQSLLPKRRLAWAAWNYHIPADQQSSVAVTYNMNILQNLDSATQFCVTLNNTDRIAPEKIIKRIQYHHPFYDHGTTAAQSTWQEINGVNLTYYCGAYWNYGFHEDGVKSALRACELFGLEKGNEQLHLQRAS